MDTISEEFCYISAIYLSWRWLLRSGPYFTAAHENSSCPCVHVGSCTWAVLWWILAILRRELVLAFTLEELYFDVWPNSAFLILHNVLYWYQSVLSVMAAGKNCSLWVYLDANVTYAFLLFHDFFLILDVLWNNYHTAKINAFIVFSYISKFYLSLWLKNLHAVFNIALCNVSVHKLHLSTAW